MISPINTAIVGINAAGKRLEASAENIARPRSSVAYEDPATQVAAAAEEINPADLVDFKLASYDIKANLTVIKTDEKNFKNLLDILS